MEENEKRLHRVSGNAGINEKIKDEYLKVFFFGGGGGFKNR